VEELTEPAFLKYGHHNIQGSNIYYYYLLLL